MYVAHVGGSVHRKRAVRGKVSTYGAVYIGRAVGYVTHVGSVHRMREVLGEVRTYGAVYIGHTVVNVTHIGSAHRKRAVRGFLTGILCRPFSMRAWHSRMKRRRARYFEQAGAISDAPPKTNQTRCCRLFPPPLILVK